MFPWFLCFLTASTSPGSYFHRSYPEFFLEHGVWWNPIESIRDINDFHIQEGDMLIPASVNKNLKSAIKSEDYLWEGGIIPFEFDINFTNSEKSLVLQAMAVLEEKTCVRFVNKTDQETFVSFEKEKNGCFAPIGKLATTKGPLPVNLQSPECFKEKGIIEHELLHVAGLFHEHSRPDRDDFVTIHWCNIRPNRATDFFKGTYLHMTTFDLPYDYSSIMHYPRWAFSRNGEPTITAKGNPNMTLGQRAGPTVNDFQKIIRMYKCEPTENHVSHPENSAHP